MADYVKKLSALIGQRRASRSLLYLRFQGFLHDQGWFNSVELQRPVDRQGNPLPWVSYAFILFIGPRLAKTMSIFEFGSGNSTLFYAQHVGSVVSVEHDETWFRSIGGGLPANVSLSQIELKPAGRYCSAALDSGKLFDMIIVDGEDRVECLKRSIPALKSGGVVVLDDSERPQYREGILHLENNEFKRLDFWGMSPGHIDQKCTSIFYRRLNCLNI